MASEAPKLVSAESEVAPLTREELTNQLKTVVMELVEGPDSGIRLGPDGLMYSVYQDLEDRRDRVNGRSGGASYIVLRHDLDEGDIERDGQKTVTTSFTISPRGTLTANPTRESHRMYPPKSDQDRSRSGTHSISFGRSYSPSVEDIASLTEALKTSTPIDISLKA